MRLDDNIDAVEQCEILDRHLDVVRWHLTAARNGEMKSQVEQDRLWEQVTSHEIQHSTLERDRDALQVILGEYRYQIKNLQERYQALAAENAARRNLIDSQVRLISSLERLIERLHPQDNPLSGMLSKIDWIWKRTGSRIDGRGERLIPGVPGLGTE